MTKMSDELKRTLGIIEIDEESAPVEVEHINHTPTIFKPKELSTQFEDDTSDKAEDYKKVRETLHELVDLTSSAMAEALDLAKDTQHPRAFEVFNNLATTVREAAKDILAIHKEMEDKKKESPKISAEKVVQNNYYGMTTEEIIKVQAKQLKNEKENIIDVI